MKFLSKIKPFENGIILSKDLIIKNTNLKRFFGGLLTVIGIASLIFAAIISVGSTDSAQISTALFTYSILGLIFFAAGQALA